jgi:hypothetical protein
LVQLVEDWLRQDELPLIKVFSPKADFQLRTPDAKGANRPSHSVRDFQITQSLLDKGWDERWIGLALSQRGTPGQGKGGGGWPHRPHTCSKTYAPPFIESYTVQWVLRPLALCGSSATNETGR